MKRTGSSGTKATTHSCLEPTPLLEPRPDAAVVGSALLSQDAMPCQWKPSRWTNRRTVSNSSINHHDWAFMFLPVGLNQRKGGVHGMGAFVEREACDLCFGSQTDIGLPAVLRRRPGFVRWKPSGKFSFVHGDSSTK